MLPKCNQPLELDFNATCLGKAHPSRLGAAFDLARSGLGMNNLAFTSEGFAAVGAGSCCAYCWQKPRSIQMSKAATGAANVR
jgi:hypothetical protein